MKRCVIVGGADIRRYDRIRTFLDEEDYFIYCDSGLKHLQGLMADPDLIVGDFDSWKNAGLSIRHRSEEEIRGFDLSNYLDADPERKLYEYAPGHKAPMLLIPPEKYDSDTMYGVRMGIEMGYRDFLLTGVAGERFDHTFANISILLMLDRLGMKGKLLDDYSEMEIISNKAADIEDRYSCFSLLNISGTARGVRIENALYTFVPNEEITQEHQFGISNEVLPGKTARVTVEEGSLLLVKVF